MIEAIAVVIGALLYRLRGGLFDDLTGIKGTQLMRAIWSVPTGIALAICASSPWWLALVLIATAFAGLALLGHGAHMVMDAERFVSGSKNKTELVTGWWLPRVFGGVPDQTWLDERRQDVTLYNVVGMSSIGLVRNLITVAPLFWFSPLFAAIYVATGLLHGPLYWVGWRVDESSAAGEYLVGGLSWVTIAGLR
jgi:hypothetical protein